MLSSSESAVLGWLTKRREERMLRRFGGLQWCPWCKQCAQNGDGWFFQRWERDTMLDVLTCGVCAGTSLWKWEIGFIYVGALEPPAPSVPSWDVYDVANARLIAAAPDLLKELTRQCENIAFILNRVDLHGFHEKFETELSEARAAISKAEGRTP